MSNFTVVLAPRKDKHNISGTAVEVIEIVGSRVTVKLPKGGKADFTVKDLSAFGGDIDFRTGEVSAYSEEAAAEVAAETEAETAPVAEGEEAPTSTPRRVKNTAAATE